MNTNLKNAESAKTIATIKHAALTSTGMGEGLPIYLAQDFVLHKYNKVTITKDLPGNPFLPTLKTFLDYKKRKTPFVIKLLFVNKRFANPTDLLLKFHSSNCAGRY